MANEELDDYQCDKVRKEYLWNFDPKASFNSSTPEEKEKRLEGFNKECAGEEACNIDLGNFTIMYSDKNYSHGIGERNFYDANETK